MGAGVADGVAEADECRLRSGQGLLQDRYVVEFGDGHRQMRMAECDPEQSL